MSPKITYKQHYIEQSQSANFLKACVFGISKALIAHTPPITESLFNLLWCAKIRGKLLFCFSRFITSFSLIVRKNSNDKAEAATKNALAQCRFVTKKINFQTIAEILYFVIDRLVDRPRRIIKNIHGVCKVTANDFLHISSSVEPDFLEYITTLRHATKHL